MRECRQRGQHGAEHTASPWCQEQLLLRGIAQGGALGQGLPASSHQAGLASDTGSGGGDFTHFPSLLSSRAHEGLLRDARKL